MFLLNTLDLLQSLVDLELIVTMFVKPKILDGDALIQIVQQYNIFAGDGYLRDLFPREFVKNRLGFDDIYEAIRLAL